MKSRRSLILLPILLSLSPFTAGQSQPVFAQELRTRASRPESLDAFLRLARDQISGERALEMVSRMDPSYRVPGNQAFDASLMDVIESLEAAGYVEESGDSENRLTYRIEHREMGRPAWDPVKASVGIVGQAEPLMTLATNINLMAAYSHSTPGGAIEAELVDAGRGRSEDFQGLDVQGKVVLGDGSTGQLFRRAVLEHGALGVLAYRLSSFNRPEENRHIAAMSSIPYDAEAHAWGLAISRQARDDLRAALSNGPVRVRVEVESRIFPSEELTLVAEVRGSRAPDERFVFSAHVQESGANDNATGVASLAEIARALAQGVRSEALSPDRTITMLWGDEITSTRRYLEEDSARTSRVRWGLSLDMVGEDTEKTGGTFLIEKMPDPGAVWTRGNERHTEWGGRPLTEEQLTPHYFNDFLLNRCLDQAAETGWVVATNPYEGGSDHVPFLRAGVPGVLFWHFTDQFYHTDGDRLEMVSAETLENVSVCAAVSAMALTSAGPELAAFVAEELKGAALARLETEVALSRAALAEGGEVNEEQKILRTWVEWYLDALGTLRDMEPEGPSASTEAAIRSAREEISEAGRRAVEGLGETGMQPEAP